MKLQKEHCTKIRTCLQKFAIWIDKDTSVFVLKMTLLHTCKVSSTVCAQASTIPLYCTLYYGLRLYDFAILGTRTQMNPYL